VPDQLEPARYGEVVTWQPQTPRLRPLRLVVAWVVCFGTMMGARGPIVSSLAARHFKGPGFATIYGTMFGWMSIAGAFGAFVSALLFDFTGDYKAGLAFSMVTVFLAVSPFWGARPLAE